MSQVLLLIALATKTVEMVFAILGDASVGKGSGELIVNSLD